MARHDSRRRRDRGRVHACAARRRPQRAHQLDDRLRRGDRLHRHRRPRHHVLGRAGHARAPPGGPRSCSTGRSPCSGSTPSRRLDADEDERTDRTSRWRSTTARTTTTHPTRPTPSDDPTIELRFSATEVLRHKDFADYTADELVEAQQLMIAPAAGRLAPPVAAADRRRRSRTTPPTCAAPCGRRCGPAANRSAATTAPAPRATDGSCCCSTSAARWSRTRGR